ncbi:MAG: Multimodular transpeptidase-transglycosylase, partial [uncultured Solirubrobacteraceae bacterium]
AAQQAARLRAARRARHPRRGLDRVRDDDGARRRAARARAADQQELPAGRRPRRRARPAHRHRAAGVRARGPHRPRDEARDHRDRGPAVLHQRRRRHPRHRTGPVAGHRRSPRRPGRLDDHPAVRQERARRAERAHRVQQAPRGRARVPPDARVVEAAHPRQLPEHHLLRQRRLRDRVGRAHLLRHQPRRLRRGPGPSLRRAAGAARGGAAGRRRRLAVGLRPPRQPGRLARAPRHRAGQDAPAGLPDARAVRPRRQRGAPAARRRAPTAGEHALPVLHLLGQAPGRRCARRRAGGRAAGLRGRPEGPHVARPQAAGGHPAGRRPPPAQPRGAAGRRGGARQPQRRGPGHGLGRRLRQRPVQPGHPGSTPARLGVQALRAGRGARAGRYAAIGLELRAQGDLRDPAPGRVRRHLRGQQLRGRLRRTAHARRGHHRLRQRRVRPGRHPRRHPARRSAGPTDGHPHPDLAELRHDARRPRAGRHPARHGAGLPDLRARRAARLRDHEPRGAERGVARRDASPVRRPRDPQRAQPARRAAQRQHGPQPAAHAARAAGRHRRPGRAAAPERGPHGHRAACLPRRGSARRRQDRHHRELRRRVVRRLDRALHRSGLGRISRPARADGTRVRGRAGGRRDVPGADLALGHGSRPAHRRLPLTGRRARGRGRGIRGSCAAGLTGRDAACPRAHARRGSAGHARPRSGHAVGTERRRPGARRSRAGSRCAGAGSGRAG